MKSFNLLPENILVIEDDSALSFLVSGILRKFYKVEVARNGMEALSWLADGNYPDLILTDIMMPSIDGMELIESLRGSGLYKDIPIIILSGESDPDKREKCDELGVDGYLMKPFKPKHLTDLILFVLESKKTRMYV